MLKVLGCLKIIIAVILKLYNKFKKNIILINDKI